MLTRTTYRPGRSGRRSGCALEAFCSRAREPRGTADDRPPVDQALPRSGLDGLGGAELDRAAGPGAPRDPSRGHRNGRGHVDPERALLIDAANGVECPHGEHVAPGVKAAVGVQVDRPLASAADRPRRAAVDANVDGESWARQIDANLGAGAAARLCRRRVQQSADGTSQDERALGEPTPSLAVRRPYVQRIAAESQARRRSVAQPRDPGATGRSSPEGPGGRSPAQRCLERPHSGSDSHDGLHGATKDDRIRRRPDDLRRPRLTTRVSLDAPRRRRCGAARHHHSQHEDRPHNHGTEPLDPGHGNTDT